MLLAPLGSSAYAAQQSRVAWAQVRQFGAFGNDAGVPDCLFTAAGDLEQLWSANGTPGVDVPRSSAIESQFAEVGSEVIAGGPQSLMALWETAGIGGTTIKQALRLPLDRVAVTAAIRRFDGIYAVVMVSNSMPGIDDLPTTVPVENNWTLANTPSSSLNLSTDSQHAVAVIGTWTGGVYAVSWGSVVKISWSWWKTFAQAAYAVTP